MFEMFSSVQRLCDDSNTGHLCCCGSFPPQFLRTFEEESVEPAPPAGQIKLHNASSAKTILCTTICSFFISLMTQWTPIINYFIISNCYYCLSRALWVFHWFTVSDQHKASLCVRWPCVAWWCLYSRLVRWQRASWWLWSSKVHL